MLRGRCGRNSSVQRKIYQCSRAWPASHRALPARVVAAARLPRRALRPSPQPPLAEAEGMRDMAIGDLMVALYKQGLDARVSRSLTPAAAGPLCAA